MTEAGVGLFHEVDARGEDGVWIHVEPRDRLSARAPYGVAGNPFHEDCIPGGSSSGSAVAVAAGLASFALGTDTAGSRRVPGFNNIVGLEPSGGW